jgi:hypothetical protein
MTTGGLAEPRRRPRGFPFSRSLHSPRAVTEPLARRLHYREQENQTIMSRFLNAALLGAALVIPVAIAPTALRAEDQKTARTYHDKKNNDDHEWNGQEDKAYRVYTKENHRKYGDFSKAKENDQQAYWGWRHEHSDALLKIDIR